MEKVVDKGMVTVVVMCSTYESGEYFNTKMMF